jgi:hypothetical protein
MGGAYSAESNGSGVAILLCGLWRLGWNGAAGSRLGLGRVDVGVAGCSRSELRCGGMAGLSGRGSCTPGAVAGVWVACDSGPQQRLPAGVIPSLNGQACELAFINTIHIDLAKRREVFIHGHTSLNIYGPSRECAAWRETTSRCPEANTCRNPEQ